MPTPRITRLPHDVRPWANMPLADLFEFLERKDKEKPAEREPAQPQEDSAEKPKTSDGT